MPTPDHRREARGKVEGPLRLSWSDPLKGALFVQGKCIDASERGMKVVVSEPIPRMCTVSVAIDRMGFSGNGTVRHVLRVGRGYVLGLQLSQPIPQSLLSKHVALPDANIASA